MFGTKLNSDVIGVCTISLDRRRLVRGRGRQEVHRYEQCCKSSNVVYAVFCERCRAYVYVGETGDTLFQRHLLNMSRIRTRHADPVAAHFYTDVHSVADFRVMGLEKLHGSEDFRPKMEHLWKWKLLTYRPYGINTQE